MEVHLPLTCKPNSPVSPPRVAATRRRLLWRPSSALWTTTSGLSTEVEKGLASADRGELLTHEEVGTRLEKLIAEKLSHR